MSAAWPSRCFDYSSFKGGRGALHASCMSQKVLSCRQEGGRGKRGVILSCFCKLLMHALHAVDLWHSLPPHPHTSPPPYPLTFTPAPYLPHAVTCPPCAAAPTASGPPSTPPVPPANAPPVPSPCPIPKLATTFAGPALSRPRYAGHALSRPLSTLSLP